MRIILGLCISSFLVADWAIGTIIICGPIYYKLSGLVTNSWSSWMSKKFVFKDIPR